MRLWDYEWTEMLDLPIDALAVLVLEDFGPQGWNQHNYFTERQQFAAYRHPPVADRIADAWAWLEAQVLIAPNPSQGSNGKRITREGLEVLASGLGRLRSARRLDVDLHATIRSSRPSTISTRRVRARRICGDARG